jgi:phosphoribosyl 1,2-cyclic phosphodiesterase
MSLFVCSLNSGSNGNCYYVGNDTEAVLIDGGISCRETEKRMKRLGLSIKKVKSIFISHEHGDHIHGVPALSKKHNIPIYISKGTLHYSKIELQENLIHSFNAYQKIEIGSLQIIAFPKFHDAADPHSFVVKHNDLQIGIFTDIGYACQHVIKHFKQCHAAFLESNYDEEMLENGRYPYHLKNRIRNGQGHLSNKQAADLFARHRPAFMSHLFLSHLSKNNNSPKIVKDLFDKIAGRTEIVIAPRDRETSLYQIKSVNSRMIRPSKSRRAISPFQLSLFQ